MKLKFACDAMTLEILDNNGNEVFSYAAENISVTIAPEALALTVITMLANIHTLRE